MTEEFNPPSRDKFREQRRKTRTRKRAKWIGIPVLLVGVAMVAAGVLLFMDEPPQDISPKVGGISVEKIESESDGTDPGTSTTIDADSLVEPIEILPASTTLIEETIDIGDAVTVERTDEEAEKDFDTTTTTI